MQKFHKNIVLVGFMGVGKSTVGKLLAKQTGYTFLDTDQVIEEKEGFSISEIFERKGENYFREIEKEVIRHISQRDDSLIVATGGGALLKPENLKNLKKIGCLICLRASAEEILKRVKNEKHRPLLRGDNPLGEIKALMRERELTYQAAEWVIETDQKTPQEIYKNIKEKILKHSSNCPLSVQVQLGGERTYPILLGRGTVFQLGEYLGRQHKGKVAVMTNPLVWKLHGAALRKSLVGAGFKILVIQIPDGERYKNIRWVNYAIGELLKNKFERGSPILAFGGGVIGDLAGFVSGTFLRGTPFVQVPTTLIAQVDSSIGGKTGVNHPLGKNLIGIFHQPGFVWMDTEFLQTLKKRDYTSGLAEVIKYGVIDDEKLFEFLEKSRDLILQKDPETVFHLVKRSCEIKAHVVSQDEKESGLRKILNYGHTMGHAIEAVTRYKTYRHGEAIAIGMHFAASVALNGGDCSKDLVERQKNLIESLNLPALLPKLKRKEILKSMAFDKKVKAGQIYFILPKTIGEVVIKPVDAKLIEKTMITLIH
ncbi:MAG: 3-dehydroquinate synthase [Nitrospirae bacterium]|nr:3-dehydroquinate synthase [Nitrospirota bacterium]